MNDELRQAMDTVRGFLHHNKRGGEMTVDPHTDAAIEKLLAAVEQLDAVEKERGELKAIADDLADGFQTFVDDGTLCPKEAGCGACSNGFAALTKYRAMQPDPCTLCHTPIPHGAELYATGTDEDAGPYCSEACRERAERKMDGGGE